MLLIGYECVLLLAAGVVLAGGASWAPLLITYAVANAGAVALVLILERPRYGSPRRLGRRSPGGAEPDLEPTAEVFIDPTTKLRMRVWIDPASGERRYRAEPD